LLSNNSDFKLKTIKIKQMRSIFKFSVLTIGASIVTTLFVNPASAQNISNAPGRFAAGVEFFSTTGFGAEVGIRLHPHLSVRGGVSLLPIKYPLTFDVPLTTDIKTRINNEINGNSQIEADLIAKGLPTNADDIKAEVNTTTTLGLTNGKILLDFYPSKKGAFHITVGTYIGKDNLLEMNGKMDQANEVLDVLKANGVDLSNEVIVKDDEAGYQLLVKDARNVNGAVTITAVKPYFGLGFGRAVPKGRVGVNFDIGALYQGVPKLTSDNSNVQKLLDSQLDGISDVLKKASFYPVLSLKLNVKLF
jgi:hypothetical protein